ncbi:MAG: LamG-like jellyroll fold domain-containing protein [Planctomycetota bacterium]|jgi:hypothetical protein
MKKTILLASILVLGLDAGVTNADFTFGKPIILGPPINSSRNEGATCLSCDGLELYIDSDWPAGHGRWDLWVVSRTTRNDPWGVPVNLGSSVNGPAIDYGPSISADGLELYFTSNRSGSFAIWVTKRATVFDPWGQAVNLGPAVNASGFDIGATISADGLELFFCSTRPGGSGVEDLWVAKRETAHDPWGVPTNLGAAVNSPAVDNSPVISADGLLLFFESNRSGGYGDFDIWFTRRTSTNDNWGPATNLGPPVNTASIESVPGIAPDGKQFYFLSTNRPGGLGGYDTWQTSIDPIVDLDADGIVDSADMCIIVDNWNTDNSLCDIGPMPWGDGVVNVEDLKVIAEHLFEQVSDPTLSAHWALDEAEGNVAHESVSGSDDVVMGNPLWQPTGGKVGGALQCDGVDDCVISSCGPDPADGPFSVFAWIKGGAPGQVIISQPASANWLMTDQEGRLLTELGMIARVGPLLSQAVITDGQWYRIGFVWDGMCRALYVDDILVAEDTVNGLAACDGGLYIGVGQDFAPGSFFSGLIDDVRIYDRAVSP